MAKTISQKKARSIFVSLMKKNFGDRKAQTRVINGVKVELPDFPKRILMTHRFNEDLGLDSLDLTELALDTEDEFAEYLNGEEIYFDAEELKTLTTVGQAIDFFVKAVEQKSSMTPEEYKQMIRNKYNFSDMGLKEKAEELESNCLKKNELQ